MKKVLLAAITMCAIGHQAQTQTNFFTKTCYRGAFAPAPTPMWTDSWTEWDPQNKTYPAPTMTVSSDITSNTTWTSGQTILLTAPIYVTGNSILTIQAGVVILGQKQSGAAIIVTKGSQINAIGTAASPIVFTTDQQPGTRAPGDWGGIILLGKAANNNSNGIGNIEGLPISSKTEYGGGTSPDDNDNSGTLQYVRIEFGGIQYQPNQEINGLTMGAVGRATTIDHIQVSFVNDDGFEWFAGTVNCKYLVSFRNVDDDFDTDYGFSGKVQFCLAVRDPQLADNPSISTSEIFESDNDPSGTAATPKTSALFSNVTAIGPLRGGAGTPVSGHRRGLRIRRNSELKVFNSIFIDNATRGLFIDGSASETNAMNGTLKFKNNILAGYGQRATESGTFGIITPNLNTWVIAQGNDTLKSASGILVNPYSYTTPDYRPGSASIALAGASFADADIAAITASFTSVALAQMPTSSCLGNGTNNTPLEFVPQSTLSAGYCSLTWSATPGVIISNSTAVSPSISISSVGSHTVYLIITDANGSQSVMTAIETTTCTDVSVQKSDKQLSTLKLFPNPATADVSWHLTLEAPETIQVQVSDITGKIVLENTERMDAGENLKTLETSKLENGLYLVKVSSQAGEATVKLIVTN